MTIKKAAIILILAIVFTSCGNTGTSNDKINIVCTIFPVYDWVREIVGTSDKIEVTLLLGSGADLHNYQPSTDDIITIYTSDMFIYVGGESDSWVNDIIKSNSNNDLIFINLMEMLGDSVKAEEIIEGMEHNENEDEHNEIELDEHIWLSLRNAQLICMSLTDKIIELDPGNVDYYMENAADYDKKLAALDIKLETITANAKFNVLLFGDRYPFRYLTDDYNLDYYAAFSGCSAESEASFETITFLVEKLNELQLHTIMVTESSDKSIAETIIANSDSPNREISVLNSLQSITLTDVKNGVTYLSIMDENCSILEAALN